MCFVYIKQCLDHIWNVSKSAKSSLRLFVFPATKKLYVKSKRISFWYIDVSFFSSTLSRVLIYGVILTHDLFHAINQWIKHSFQTPQLSEVWYQTPPWSFWYSLCTRKNQMCWALRYSCKMVVIFTIRGQSKISFSFSRVYRPCPDLFLSLRYQAIPDSIYSAPRSLSSCIVWVCTLSLWKFLWHFEMLEDFGFVSFWFV